MPGIRRWRASIWQMIPTAMARARTRAGSWETSKGIYYCKGRRRIRQCHGASSSTTSRSTPSPMRPRKRMTTGVARKWHAGSQKKRKRKVGQTLMELFQSTCFGNTVQE